MNSQIHQAHSYRDWAVYEFKAGNHSEGEDLWEKARDLFEQCGATFEVERMKELPE